VDIFVFVGVKVVWGLFFQNVDLWVCLGNFKDLLRRLNCLVSVRPESCSLPGRKSAKHYREQRDPDFFSLHLGMVVYKSCWSVVDSPKHDICHKLPDCVSQGEFEKFLLLQLKGVFVQLSKLSQDLFVACKARYSLEIGNRIRGQQIRFFFLFVAFDALVTFIA
jgi:hypothetical protein